MAHRKHLLVSIFALLAMIMLVGIVSKNSILLVDYAKTPQRRGVARNEAIVEAEAKRIRPILMTAATMVVAMHQLAFWTGSEASQRHRGTLWLMYRRSSVGSAAKMLACSHQNLM